jgi:hypothetical protein
MLLSILKKIGKQNLGCQIMDFDVSAVTVDEAALAEFDRDYRVDHNH